jgi:myosin heavy subunit
VEAGRCGTSTDGELRPHLWGVGATCYQHLFSDPLKPKPLNQAMIITGESGAGKSYSTTKV